MPSKNTLKTKRKIDHLIVQMLIQEKIAGEPDTAKSCKSGSEEGATKPSVEIHQGVVYPSYKTSTVINLGYALSLKKKKVLIIDFDLHGGATHHLSEKFKKHYSATIFEVLTKKCKIEKSIHEYDKNLHLIPSSYKIYQLANTDFSNLLKSSIESIENQYDFIFFDLSPAIYKATTTFISISNFILIPSDCQGLSWLGIETAKKIIGELITKGIIETEVDLIGIIPSFVDRTRVTREVEQLIIDKYPEHALPRIRRTTAIAQAAILGKSIFEHKPKSNGAQDYKNLAKAFLKKIKKGESIV